MSVRESATTVAARPEDERLSIGANIAFGLQHILSMFGGVIAVPLIIGGAAGLKPEQTAIITACSLFISGLATILQTVGAATGSRWFGFGSQLPLVQGISFASVSTLLAIIGKAQPNAAGAKIAGLQTAYGAIIAAGIVALLIVPFFSQVIRFFPPVVTGSIITVIGLSLMPAAGKWITGNPTIVKDGAIVANPTFGQPNAIALAVLTLAITLALSMVKRLARMAVLLGLAIGWLLSPLFGLAKAPNLNSPVLAFPQPLAFGPPIFEAGAIISMFIVLVVIMVETTADLLAVGSIVGTEVDSNRVANGLRADMLSCVVAPLFNTFPATAFAQNVGLVALSGIKSRWVVTTGGVILAVLGLSPLLASLIGALPTPVLGGAGIVLFGMVAASGIRSLSKVNFDGNNNLLIVATAVGFGLLPSLFPHIAGAKGVYLPGFWHSLPDWASVILDSGISTAAIVAFVLNLVFNVWGKGEDATVHVTEAHRPARAVTVDDLAKLDASHRPDVS